MKSPTISTPLVATVIFGLIAIVCLFVMQILTLPKLKETRATIDRVRANVILTQRRQANIQAVKRDIESLQEQEATLNKELWSFKDEDAFFNFWDGLVSKHKVTIDVPTIADAIPREQPIERAATITIDGSLENIMAVIQEAQKHQPLIVMDSINLGPNKDNTQTVATISTRTLWK